jgi:glycosyltransferase involved in cell wall biosynthesis
MNIIQIATGLITIPPNGWGAVERLIWEYKQGLEKLGHTVTVQHINEVEYVENTIVHTHLANLALACRDKGIPYVYSLHDHHAEWYGKDSWVYQKNLEAIKGSIISFTHAEHVIDYFSETDKLFFLSHGANTDFFIPAEYNGPITQHSLLMIANNGLAGDSGFDRKGFRYAIEAAKELDLPITIAGPENNKLFFEANPDLLEYEKLTLELTNPSDELTSKLYKDHTIFVAPSMLEYGHPNLTMMEASSACIPTVSTYKGSKKIAGLYVLPNISVQSVIEGIKDTIANYEYRKRDMMVNRDRYDWCHVVKTLERYYENVLKIDELYDSNRTRDLYIKAYSK